MVMANNKRLKFELRTIYERTKEIEAEYNNDPGSKNERIEDTRMNLKSGFIRVRFNTYAYLVFVYKHAYIFSWFHHSGEKFINDGSVTCMDVSQVMRELNDRIFSGFSPKRGLKWYQYDKPKRYDKKK